ncbi:MAG: hypothetical protein AB8G86_02215 [Saprospiraceae bacterium]
MVDYFCHFALELRGKYKTQDKEGDFFAADLPCVNVKFELYKDQLSEAIFSYPCRGKKIGQVDVKSMSVDDLSANPIKKETGQIYWIDGKTFGKDTEKIIAELSALEIFDGFSFNPATNSFNGNYFYEKGKTNFIEVEDVTKRPIKIIIKNGLVAKLKITGNPKDGIGFIRNEFLDKRFQHPFSTINVGTTTDTLTYLVSNEMTRIELYEMIDNISEHSQVQINLDPLKTKFDAQDKLVAISGKYYYERPTRTPIQTFEVADLGQFQLQFKAHPTISFAPAYYNKATNKFIQVDDNYSAFGAFAKEAVSIGGPLIVPNRTYKNIHAILIINQYTDIADLKAFAEKILPNNIIFRYQDSEIRADGTIAKLVGDFLGNSRISEPFYVDDLTKYQVKLRVDKNYIYQPEITQQMNKRRKYDFPFEVSPEDSIRIDSIRRLNGIPLLNQKKQLEPEKQLSFKIDNKLKREYEMNLIQAKNEKERVLWREKLVDLEEREKQFKERATSIFKQNFPDKIAKSNAKRPALSYQITNWDVLGLDSAAFQLKEDHNNYQGENLAQFIPSYVAVDDSVRAMNPIYRGEMEKVKSIFVNGQKMAKKDLPVFMQNNLQTAIKTAIPKTKRYPKTDTSVDWLYWGDQKINLGEVHKKKENGELEWDVPELEIDKAVWDSNKDRPFIFQIDGNWHRVKDLDMVVLVPYKEDPASVNFYKNYAKALTNKAGSAFKLLAKAKEKDYLYFEKMDIGLPKLVGMVVKIVENESTEFIPKANTKINQPNQLNHITTDETSNTKKMAVAAERNISLPTIGMNSPNRVHWDNLAFEVKGTVKRRTNEAQIIQISTLEITQAQWEQLYNQPFTLDFNHTWYKVKKIKEVVLVPFKKYPKSANLYQDYYQIIKDKNHRATKLLAEANIGDHIYFERIDVGKAFTFGMVVKIVENQLK